MAEASTPEDSTQPATKGPSVPMSEHENSGDVQGVDIRGGSNGETEKEEISGTKERSPDLNTDTKDGTPGEQAKTEDNDSEDMRDEPHDLTSGDKDEQGPPDSSDPIEINEQISQDGAATEPNAAVGDQDAGTTENTTFQRNGPNRRDNVEPGDSETRDPGVAPEAIPGGLDQAKSSKHMSRDEGKEAAATEDGTLPQNGPEDSEARGPEFGGPSDDTTEDVAGDAAPIEDEPPQQGAQSERGGQEAVVPPSKAELVVDETGEHALSTESLNGVASGADLVKPGDIENGPVIVEGKEDNSGDVGQSLDADDKMVSRGNQNNNAGAERSAADVDDGVEAGGNENNNADEGGEDGTPGGETGVAGSVDAKAEEQEVEGGAGPSESKNSSEAKQETGKMAATTEGGSDMSNAVVTEAGEGRKASLDARSIPPDLFYDFEELVSKARVTEESGLPADMMTLEHSFGYDCHRMSNLHMVDPDTVIFAAGNVVEILNIQTGEQKYIRSMSGGGIGAITVHPRGQYFVIAEKGDLPLIGIYEYPSLRLYRLLREGTEKAYSFVDFNPSGSLLASVGSYPDFMLTVWDWQQEKTMLRTKAFSQDVFRVTFSPDNEGQLTSSGTGHIRFWKMATTFTGLKLQGELGKFGRTEISDIRGYVELPDGKVLSGTEWGNLLLWEGGLIKVQISRKNRKPCHAGCIEQFVMDEGELISIGADGFVRVWDFESVDTADSMDDSGIFEMEPMNELKVGNNVHLMSMVKTVDPEATGIWYAQDGNGGIWKLDLSFSHTMEMPEKLFSYHSGEITAVAASPVSQLVASTGIDDSVCVYDYISKTALCQSKFNSSATSLLWLPQIVDPKGSVILAGFHDGVVRALTIARSDEADAKRSTHPKNADLSLKQAFKPHTRGVTDMKIDSKGELLATGGEDSTVFFLSISDTFSPIGFLETPGPVSSLTWSPGYHEKNTLLIFCSNGEIMEVEAPEPGSYDTSKTFKIEGLSSRQMKFTSIKSRLRREEEEARKREEEEKKRQEEEKKRQLRRQRGLDSDEEGEGDEKKDEEKEEEPEPLYIPETPSPILFGVYSPQDPNKFWVSMSDFDAGYLYELKFFDDYERATMMADGRECTLNEPVRSVPVIDSDDVPITTLSFTHDGKYAIVGMENGVVRVQSIELGDDLPEDRLPDCSQADLSTLTNYWMLNVHDNHYGRITGLTASFDDRHVFSAATDGNFFVFAMMSSEQIEEAKAVARAKIPSARKDGELLAIVDIESKDHYSIEKEKQQAEYDKMMKLAEEKKTDVRRTIAKLRRQFKKLLEKNEELPGKLQLERKEFEMDPGIRQELERQTQERIDLVRKELAWEAEKHRIALEKLEHRFKAELECERVVVISVNSTHQVATYRTTEISKEFNVIREEFNRQQTIVSEAAISRESTRASLGGDTKLSESMSEATIAPGTQGTKKSTVLTGRQGEKVNQALQKAEKAKQKKLSRQKQVLKWDELNASKPPEDHEDPADVQAIKEARENMGDFRLKTAKDYVVPEHLRMNALKKRNQLLILEELSHQYKMEFNRRVLALRDKKISMIERIKKYLTELREVQQRISEENRKPLPECPTLHPEEVPERKFQYTSETLLKFKEEMAQRKLEAITGQGGGFGGGFGGSGGGSGAGKQEAPKDTGAGRVRSRLSLRSAQVRTAPSISDTGAELSPLEVQLAAAENIRLLYQQDKLLQQVSELVARFDAELRTIRHAKFNLDIDLKNADLRKVTLFEELQLLKEFEKRENILAEKVTAKIRERTEMQSKVMEIQQRLDSKRKDIDRLSDKERALNANFQASLGENNKFAEFLTKVFKKKIKRAKKKAQADEGSDEDESEESSEEESDWSSEDDASEEGTLDDSVCPPGCEQELFDKACALRERRLDIEEMMAEEKKNADTLKKDVDALVKKQRIIENSLKTAEADLEAFQLEKQQKLNELDVVVTLRFHQIEYMVNGSLPQDLSPCLVFTRDAIKRLKKRILELEEEKTAQKKHYRDHRQQHIQLIKDRRLMEQRIQDLDDQCNEAMRLKFGQVIDLDKLDTVGVNRNVEELKEKIRLGELENVKELKKMDGMIEAKKRQITDLTEDNTQRIQLMTRKLGEKKELEKALDARQTSLGDEFQGSRKADIVERKRLVQLVQLQAQEIDALKDEIGILSRKGGHILPPSQPPLPRKSPGGKKRNNLQAGPK